MRRREIATDSGKGEPATKGWTVGQKTELKGRMSQGQRDKQETRPGASKRGTASPKAKAGYAKRSAVLRRHDKTSERGDSDQPAHKEWWPLRTCKEKTDKTATSQKDTKGRKSPKENRRFSCFQAALPETDRTRVTCTMLAPLFPV